MQEIMTRDGFPKRSEAEGSTASRTLRAGEVLFRAGERKSEIYRVDAGVICLYDPHSSGDDVFVEFLFPGDLVGMGILDTHCLSARAMADARLASLPLAEAEEALAENHCAEAKLAKLVEREFEARREELAKAGQNKPLERLAALLLNLSANNAYEGRDRYLIVESIETETWSHLLGVERRALKGMLLELSDLDLIEQVEPSSLRLSDIPALEELADGKPAARRGSSQRKAGSRPPRSRGKSGAHPARAAA